MIENDDCGMFFCFDTLLALIPLFIILATVTTIQIDPSSNLELVLFHEAEDTLNLMSVKNNSYGTSILEQLSENKLEPAKRNTDLWLKNRLGNKKYRLVQITPDEQEICAYGDMTHSKIIVVAIKSQNGHIFKLYLGL